MTGKQGGHPLEGGAAYWSHPDGDRLVVVHRIERGWAWVSVADEEIQGEQFQVALADLRAA